MSCTNVARIVSKLQDPPSGDYILSYWPERDTRRNGMFTITRWRCRNALSSSSLIVSSVSNYTLPTWNDTEPPFPMLTLPAERCRRIACRYKSSIGSLRTGVNVGCDVSGEFLSPSTTKKLWWLVDFSRDTDHCNTLLRVAMTRVSTGTGGARLWLLVFIDLVSPCEGSSLVNVRGVVVGGRILTH